MPINVPTVPRKYGQSTYIVIPFMGTWYRRGGMRKGEGSYQPGRFSRPFWYESHPRALQRYLTVQSRRCTNHAIAADHDGFYRLATASSIASKMMLLCGK